MIFLINSSIEPFRFLMIIPIAPLYHDFCGSIPMAKPQWTVLNPSVSLNGIKSHEFQVNLRENPIESH